MAVKVNVLVSYCVLTCLLASGVIWEIWGRLVFSMSTSSRVKRMALPAFWPPASVEVRLGTTITSLVPKLAKMVAQAWPKPLPQASSMTTVAMPQAMPSMVSAVRRRLCRMAS